MEKKTKDTYHHGNLRELLIMSGLKIIARDGITGFSMRKLTAEIGVSHTAAYRHFANKEELLSAIFSDAAQKFYSALEESVSTIKDPHEQLSELGIGYVQFFVQNPDMMSIFTVALSLPGVMFPNSFELFEKITQLNASRPELAGLSQTEMLLGYWAKVHGLAALLTTSRQFLPFASDISLDDTIRHIVRTSF